MTGQSQGGQYHNEREEARARLKASVDALTERANLQVQMQKEPLKMLGGASAVGTLLGIVVGRQFRRSKKVYVDAGSPAKHQKALIKAQQGQKGGGVGSALAATLGTLAFKALNDRVLAPKLEKFANGLLERAGQQPGHRPGPQTARPAAQAPTSARPTSAGAGGTASFLKRPATESPASLGYAQQSLDSVRPAAPAHPGELPSPQSAVEAKAQGTPIAAQEKANPNLR
jgi:hypothetical protein